VVAALLYSQVVCPYGRRGRRIRLSGEARVERRLRASVEEGRSSILNRSIGARGPSSRSAVACRLPLCQVSASDCALVPVSTPN
jgi:hypothetical protein